jgi:DNA mismatch repair ATPase MutS
MKQNRIENYQTRIEKYTQEAQKIRQRVYFMGFVRLIEFLTGISLVIILFESKLYTSGNLVIVGFGFLFLYLVKIHASLKEKKQHIDNLVQINQKEAEALQGNISAFDTGKELMSIEHPYEYDLDILGEKSLFQFLNRTCSALGKYTLADWLKYPQKDKEEILARQAAIQELKDKIDWRQNLGALASLADEKQAEKDNILAWLKEPPILLKNKIYPVLLLALPLITLALTGLAIFGFIPVNILFLFSLINLVIVALHSGNFVKQASQISLRAKFLKKYSRLLEAIEKETFASAKLQSLQKQLVHDHKTASQHLKTLSGIINNIEQGASLVGVIFNSLFLWNLQFLFRLEKWQANLQDDIDHWFASVGEIDALASLANLHYNYPEYAFPQVSDKQYVLKADELGHPLLKPEIRVNNPIDLSDLGQLMLITGANMAGKSTYLRTVGVNLVLAMTGAPVCAKRFDFQPIDIYTSMRTKDSLQENESFFYAELKRLKMVIDQLSEGKTIFVILDEILKGTNSADQHTGSQALIEQLIKLKGVGLIATHDLALGELAQKYPQNIQNQCFEIEIIDEELAFDYKLRAGINQNLNATFLMKKMGITV